MHFQNCCHIYVERPSRFTFMYCMLTFRVKLTLSRNNIIMRFKWMHYRKKHAHPFVSDMTWLRITLAMSGKFCVSCSFSIIPLYSTEAYPTVVRNVGYGASSFCGRIGGLLAPYISLLVCQVNFGCSRYLYLI